MTATANERLALVFLLRVRASRFLILLIALGNTFFPLGEKCRERGQRGRLDLELDGNLTSGKFAREVEAKASGCPLV